MARAAKSARGSARRSAESSAEIAAGVIAGSSVETPSLFDASGDSRVRLYRRDEQKQKMVFHGYLPPDATEETIAEATGGGYYKVQLLVRNGEGKEVIETSRELSIPGAYKPITGSLPGVGVPATIASSPVAQQQGQQNGGGDNMGSVLNAAMVSTVVDLLRMGKEVASSRPDPAASLAPILQQMSEDRKVMFALIERMGTQQQQPVQSRTEFFEEIKLMQSLLGPRTDSSSEGGLAKMLEQFRLLKEMGQELGGDKGDKDTDPLSLLPGVLELLTNEQRLRATPPAQPQPAQRRLTHGAPGAGPQPQPQPTGQPVPETASKDVLDEVLAKHGAVLVSSAKAGRSPELIAGMAVQFAPKALLERLGEYFQKDDDAIVSELIAKLPELAAHKEWVEEFVVAANTELFGPEEDDDPVIGDISPVPVATEGTDPPPVVH